jgi:capsule polysaccharide export protein KpsC/LpsZ
MLENIIYVDMSFAIHGRGAVSVMPKSLDQSPNSVEFVLTNNLDQYTSSVEVPLNILFTKNGRIGIITMKTTGLIRVINFCIVAFTHIVQTMMVSILNGIG